MEGFKIRDPTEKDYLALQGSTLSAPVNSMDPDTTEIAMGKTHSSALFRHMTKYIGHEAGRISPARYFIASKLGIMWWFKSYYSGATEVHSLIFLLSAEK